MMLAASTIHSSPRGRDLPANLPLGESREKQSIEWRPRMTLSCAGSLNHTHLTTREGEEQPANLPLGEPQREATIELRPRTALAYAGILNRACRYTCRQDSLPIWIDLYQFRYPPLFSLVPFKGRKAASILFT
jgi:hypothetical protein